MNLFEKVKIPECAENIRRIRIFLGDENTGAVVRSKMFERPDDVTAKDKLTKDDDPDGFVFDLDKNDKNAAEDTIVGAGKEMDDQQLRAIWLRQGETKPADFLKSKFAYQHTFREDSPDDE